MDEWIEARRGEAAAFFADGASPDDPVRLAAHVAAPNGGNHRGAIVLCHGFPAGPGGATLSAATYPEFADRMAAHTGSMVLTFNFRGTGTSEGEFSFSGWRSDVRAAVDELCQRSAMRRVACVGSSLGGAVVLDHAVDDDRVAGVATLGCPTGGLWSRNPGEFLEHARRVGVIRADDFPEDRGAWCDDAASLDPVVSAEALGERPLLVLHGSDDDVAPVEDARALAQAGGSRAELHIVHQAGHQLRHDPRAVAVLLGWLERL
ncbi:MAG: alpha/beta fold hydrolase [Acidimicrobiia bacterium]